MPGEISRFEGQKAERMERFQSLEAGAYWRSTKAFPFQGIDAQEVLLIESILWADDAPHTVVVRAHPNKIGRRFQYTRQDGDRTYTSYGEHNTHRFLVEEFLLGFEFEPDHERIRAEEIQKVQERITELQSELVQAQSNPAILGGVVEQELAKREAAKPASEGSGNLPALTLRPADLMGGATLPSILQVGITEKHVDAMRGVAERQHEIATIKASWIRARTEQIGETVKRMTPYFEEQAAAALARTEEVRAHVDKLKRGIETLDLYVGRNVSVETIRTGASAPAGEPLTLVQRKLMMDEELALWCDLDQWFDFTKDDLFLDALREHDGLVDQIFPAQRCVLLMATTARHIDYGDVWTNNAKGSMNKEVFLLVRDGENIHRVRSGVESHLGSHRLFPSLNEMQSKFSGINGSTIGLEDVAYTDRLSVYEAAALHYKRFLILMCGLDHRLDLFGPFYQGEKTFDFVSSDFQERHMRFIFDDEGSTAIAGDIRMPVKDWIASMNRYLVAGSRVMCAWKQVMTPESAPGAVSRRTGNREYVDFRYRPKVDMSVAIASKRGPSLIVEVDVKGWGYGSDGDRSFSCKVDLGRYEEGYNEALAFLCLDAVRPEDLRWYLNNRRSRADHVHYIRFFKTAIAYLEKERAGEVDARNRMRQALVDGNIGDAAEHDDIVDRTVLAWRAANRGKPFPSFSAGKAPKEWKGILDQMASLAGNSGERVARIAGFAKNLGYDPLRVVITGKGALAVYAAPAAAERDDRLESHAWVHRIEVETRVDEVVEVARRWVALPEVVASETVLSSWDANEAWSAVRSAFQSPDHKKAVFDLVAGWEQTARFWTSKDQDQVLACFGEWRSVRNDLLAKSSVVENPYIDIPVGLMRDKRGRVTMVCLYNDRPHVLIGARAAEDWQADVETEYVRPFLSKSLARDDFRSDSTKGVSWNLNHVELPSIKDAQSWNPVHKYAGGSGLTFDDRREPSLIKRFAKRLPGQGEVTFWFGAGDIEVTSLPFDTVLDLRTEVHLDVHWIYTVTVRTSTGCRKWIDVVPEKLAVRDEEAVITSMPWVERKLVGGEGYSIGSHEAFTRSEADAYVRRALKDEKISTLPKVDGFNPPEGIDRHWLVKDW